MPEPHTRQASPGLSLMASLTEIRAKDFQALQDEMFNVVMDRWIELNFSTDNWSESTEGVCTNRIRQIGQQPIAPVVATRSCSLLATTSQNEELRTASSIRVQHRNQLGVERIGDWQGVTVWAWIA